MTPACRFFHILILCCLCCLLRPVGAVADNATLLVVHSSSRGAPWPVGVDQGVAEVWPGPIISFALAGDRFDDEDHFDERFGDLARLTEGASIPVVVADGEVALAFVRKYRELLSASVVVFCAVPPLDPAAIDQLGAGTGVYMLPGGRETVEDIAALHPAMDTLVILTDSWEGRRELRMDIDAAAERQGLTPRYPGFEPGEPQAMDPDTALSVATNMPPDAAMLLLDFRTITGDEKRARFMEQIVRESPSPVYGLTDELMGKGLAGGTLISVADQGRAAARLALRIADGEPASAIAPRTLPNVREFDLSVLARFGVTRDMLPPGSRGLNAPAPASPESDLGRIAETPTIALALAFGAGLVIWLVWRRRS